jgi:hypothetical protein
MEVFRLPYSGLVRVLCCHGMNAALCLFQYFLRCTFTCSLSVGKFSRKTRAEKSSDSFCETPLDVQAETFTGKLQFLMRMLCLKHL